MFCLSRSAPGQHGLQLLLNWKDLLKKIKKQQNTLKDYSVKNIHYTMVVFRHGEQLKWQDIKAFVLTTSISNMQGMLFQDVIDHVAGFRTGYAAATL